VSRPEQTDSAGHTVDLPSDAPAAPATPAPLTSASPGFDLGLTWLGHSSVLLDLPQLRLLTDPFLRDHLGPLRRHGPVPDPGAIGRVDVVAISHAHPDHFDPGSLQALAGDPLVVVPRGLGGNVRRLGLRTHELEVGETVELGSGCRITAVPARHWRWPVAPRARTVGYLVESADRAGIYFAGDTAPFGAMRELTGRVDLALLPVGSWGPHVSPGHLTPKTAAAVARVLGARVAVPIHWGTLYPPKLDRWFGDRLREPASQFVTWAERLTPTTEVHALDPGGTTRVRL
jgi:L-ascorbate metabolism protein UlaG (beta-lactamase superfamily)